MSKQFKDTKAFSIIKSIMPAAAGIIENVPLIGPLAADAIRSTLKSHEAKQIDLTPDEIKELNAQLLEIENLENEDRASARNREIEMAKAGKKDWFMSVAGIAALAIFLFIVFSLVFLDVPEANKTLFTHLIGIIEGVIVSIYAYYWGSSRGSRDKTAMLKKQD